MHEDDSCTKPMTSNRSSNSNSTRPSRNNQNMNCSFRRQRQRHRHRRSPSPPRSLFMMSLSLLSLLLLSLDNGPIIQPSLAFRNTMILQQQRESLGTCRLRYNNNNNNNNIRTSTVPPLFARKKPSSNKTNKNKKNTSAAGSGFGTSNNKKTVSSSASKNTRSLSSGRGMMGVGSKALRKAANTFDAIRKQYGPTACRDLYIKSPLNSPTTYWFVGKIAFVNTTSNDNENDDESDDDDVDDVDDENDDSNNNTNNNSSSIELDVLYAIVAQKRLILEYAINELRPQNFGGRQYSQSLQIWYGPGDSEMDVVQNKVHLQPAVGISANDLPDTLDLNKIGFNPEIYVGDEITQGGLRVELDENGKPMKPVFDINPSL